MGVLVGESNETTSFSYLEYQAFMLVLAASICMGLLAIELTMNRFQVLPLLFPGMFSIRERRFYFFDFDVSNGQIAEKLRHQAKMLVRMTLCVVLSYLWQHCVMYTSQQVGTQFPEQQCRMSADCWTSDLHFLTLLSRQHTPVDCDQVPEDFPRRVVISCIRFIQPSASAWLMHLAIAHSVTQLNLRTYEILVWVAGNSPRMGHFMGCLTLLSLSVCIGLFFGGFISEFASSWLSFVTLLAVPIFFYNVYHCAKVLEVLWAEENSKVHLSVEEHFNSVLSEFAPEVQDGEPFQEGGTGRSQGQTGPKSVAKRAKNLLRLSNIPGMRGPTRNAAVSVDHSSLSSPRTAANTGPGPRSPSPTRVALGAESGLAGMMSLPPDRGGAAGSTGQL